MSLAVRLLSRAFPGEPLLGKQVGRGWWLEGKPRGWSAVWGHSNTLL